ncbi:MAG: hypothetical protein V1720_20285 [bacterium]
MQRVTLDQATILVKDLFRLLILKLNSEGYKEEVVEDKGIDPLREHSKYHLRFTKEGYEAKDYLIKF